ncbi:MAG: hypothetical protein ACOX9C_00460 [Kiritimatiellia bacterium]
MNISKTVKAFAIAAVVGLTAQVVQAAPTEWWSEDFDTVADMTALTNVNYSAEGRWTTAEGDESAIDTQQLKLDTQGNNLTWTPSAASTSTVVLVDADLYLVGSDTAPTGFDPDGDVQTAVYLKNNLDENGDITDSVLCAYVAPRGTNEWVELEGVGVSFTNEAWYAVQIKVDYSGASPKASFIVDDVLLNEKGGATTAFLVSNTDEFGTPATKKVSSVSFRGTGRVDNFIGWQDTPEQAATITFTVETYTDNELDAAPNLVAGSVLTVVPGTPLKVNFAENETATGKYLTFVRVYTNATQCVEYNPDWDNGWTLPAGLTYDGDNECVQLNFDTTGLPTEFTGYIVKGYYGQEPSGGVEPTSPTIQPVSGHAAVEFETISDDEYFVVSFVAPEAGVTYVLESQTVLGGAWAEETDDLATATSLQADEEITLKAPTGGAATKFFRVKAYVQ